MSMDSDGRITTHYAKCDNYNPIKGQPVVGLFDQKLGQVYECANFEYEAALDEGALWKTRVESGDKPCFVCRHYTGGGAHELSGLDWEQSTFVKDCPIYTLTIDKAVVLRIEYVITLFDNSPNYWQINVLGNFKVEKLTELKRSDVEKVKVMAENLLINTIGNLKQKITKK